MPSWLPSYPYPAPQEGYWEPITSTINWCEEDYYATKYSAEIVNTITNLLFQYLAWKGIFNCIYNKHDTIFLITFVGYFLVGTGSFLFHSTLKYPMQLVDELSMIYSTCITCFATFGHKKPAPISLLLGIFLISLAAFITCYYHYLQDPAFHQNAFAILAATVIFRAVYIMEVNIRPKYRKQGGIFPQQGFVDPRATLSKKEQDRQDERDSQIMSEMWTMIAYGLSIFLGGFALWNVDNEFCGTLRAWRHEIGLPWGVLLEGHGWWHIMTGVGSYFYIVWGCWLRHCLNGRQDEYELYWPSKIWSMPAIIRKSAMTKANGVTKKTL